MKISRDSIEASCCNADKGEEKSDDLPLAPSPEKLIESIHQEVNTCEENVMFTNDDLLLGDTLYNRPLYLVGYMRDERVNRIFVDGGSSVNILPIRTVKELGIPMNELLKSHVMIQGFNQGGQRAIGAIMLGITIEDMQSSSWMHAIDAKTSYNVLLRRPWLDENKVVPSTYHQCLKYYEDEVEKKIPYTVVYTKERDEDEESVGSSYHVTAQGEHGVLSLMEDDEKLDNVSPCYHISFNDVDPQEDEDAKDAPPELEEGVKATIYALKEEFRDVFAWSYKEIPGLDPKVVVHHIAVKNGARPIKQAQRRFRPDLVPLIETEVNKLIEAGFIREVKCLTWVSSIVHVRKKNGHIRVCIDFRDLNNACPKDEFPLPIPELMIDATTEYEAMSFMDSSSGYNQTCMAPKDK
ncbi:uncharacterized protein [Nicotiana tomentosiformis]|uniref:uncharacterized protein n=1 Tax=Nicotiana tomentosiformis TaxID=4098 RepID=UPI00388CDD1C